MRRRRQGIIAIRQCAKPEAERVSERSLIFLLLMVTVALGSVYAVNDQFGVDVETRSRGGVRTPNGLETLESAPRGGRKAD